MKKLIRWLRFWQCRRNFKKVDPKFQELFTKLGYDPESKMKRGDFNAH